MFGMVAGAIAAAFAAVGIGYAVTHKKGKLTPARKAIFDAAMASLTDANKLRQLADTFEAEGLPDQAAALRKKAANLDLPPAKKDQQRQILNTGLNITRTDQAAQVQNLANAFRDQGATNAANALDQHASDLRQAAAQGIPHAPVAGTTTGPNITGPIVHDTSGVHEATGPMPSSSGGKVGGDRVIAEGEEVHPSPHAKVHGDPHFDA